MLGVKQHCVGFSCNVVLVQAVDPDPRQAVDLFDTGRRQVLGFLGKNTLLGGQDSCFYYLFERNFSGHNKIWVTQKIWEGISPGLIYLRFYLLLVYVFISISICFVSPGDKHSPLLLLDRYSEVRAVIISPATKTHFCDNQH